MSNSASETRQVAVHEAGHAAAALVLDRRLPCCVRVSLRHEAGHLPSGSVNLVHGSPISRDMRLSAAMSRAGETAEMAVFGRFMGDGEDRAVALRRWRDFEEDEGPHGDDLFESLWSASLDLARWAVEPNLVAVERLADVLSSEPLLQGARLERALWRCSFVEPPGPRPSLWTIPEGITRIGPDA